jgi:RAB protein geranylgeranyltransferase component A
MSAVILHTPIQYLNYRQIFEIYVCKDITEKIPNFVIQKEHSFDNLAFKLKDNLFLFVKFIINIADNKLNQNYPDREIMCFKDGGILKSFSFK